MSSDDKTTVGPNSKTTLGVMASGFVVLATVGWWASQQFFGLKTAIETQGLVMQARFEKIEMAVSDLNARADRDIFKLTVATEWAQRLAYQNLGIKVPDPRNLGESFYFAPTKTVP